MILPWLIAVFATQHYFIEQHHVIDGIS